MKHLLCHYFPVVKIKLVSNAVWKMAVPKIGGPVWPTPRTLLTPDLCSLTVLPAFRVIDGKCYEVRAGVVCLQVKLCDPHLSALEVRFSRWGAIQIYVYLYLYLYKFKKDLRRAWYETCVWLRAKEEISVASEYTWLAKTTLFFLKTMSKCCRNLH